ncbi:MAG: DUF1512 domain-containing protein [Nanoarchaeota archaeon]|nr:DUF1512 domain-containing protein [Nanoarchaeota archaeon]MBU4124551.1 DUF1512 domain-containing protein [Nanoarchaeota archaeon]
MFGMEGDMFSTIIWFVLFIFFMLYGSKIMVTQTILKIEKDVTELETMAKKSRGYVLNSISKNPSPKVKQSVANFMEFFAVSPVTTDPYGVMKKLDHIIKQADKRFDYFVNSIVPDFSKEKKRDMRGALSGAMTTHQIAKIVRHFLEQIKKYKMLQLAMILQMQIPMILSLSKSAMYATKAFLDETPIGDSIGPLVAAHMMNGKVTVNEEEEFAYVETKMNGRKVIIAKADGPGATVAMPGKFMQKIMKKRKITRILTIDAGLKMEGEKSGSIAEGVGIAMNPAGTDRYEIEEVAVNRKIPMDAIVIKVSEEDALMPMRKEIINSVSNAIGVVRENINRAKKNETILIMGVGNTCGVGNNPKAALEAEKKARNALKKEEKPKKKYLNMFGR